MSQIWTDENKFSKFLLIEICNCEAYYNLKVIPERDFVSIQKNANFCLERVNELEKITKHDVIAFTRAVSESLGEEKKWIHYSLTSTDVVDSAQALLIKDANKIIDQDIQVFLDVLKKNAIRDKKLPCMGRTHGMHAEVTSFGLKWVLWYDEMVRNYQRFKQACQEVEMIKISGAVGNYADVDPYVEQFVAKKLDMAYAPISTQVLSRDRFSNYIMTLSLIASTIEKIAFEVRNLSRTEVKEVEEYFNPNQKGSSAMPHKRNPIASENMCGCARVLRSYVSATMENNPLWHERDISHSSVERIILPDATSLIDYMLKRYTKVLDQLTIFPKRMLKNISLTNGVVFSSRVLSKLIEKGLSRESAYDLIQPLAFKALEDEESFEEILKNSEVKKYLNDAEISSCFDTDFYLRNVDVIYKRFNL